MCNFASVTAQERHHCVIKNNSFKYAVSSFLNVLVKCILNPIHSTFVEMFKSSLITDTSDMSPCNFGGKDGLSKTGSSS